VWLVRRPRDHPLVAAVGVVQLSGS
jgi:hypothetical protein